MPRDIHIHVEEPSMAAFLSELLPRHFDPTIRWRVIEHGSKKQLLAHLPLRLRGYANIPLPYRPRALVLVDRDQDDCLVLKARLEAACVAPLETITRSGVSGAFDVVNRIVIEELEAWFFGDAEALEQGWAGSRRRLRNAAYRQPDAIRGGTHEALLRVLKGAGHLTEQERLPKIETARTMGTLVVPERNTSPSFHHFWAGLNALATAA